MQDLQSPHLAETSLPDKSGNRCVCNPLRSRGTATDVDVWVASSLLLVIIRKEYTLADLGVCWGF